MAFGSSDLFARAHPGQMNTQAVMQQALMNNALTRRGQDLQLQSMMQQLGGQRDVAGIQARAGQGIADTQARSAQAIAAAQNAAELQRTGMQTGSAERIAGGQQAGLTERERMSQSGQTERTRIGTESGERLGKYQQELQNMASNYGHDMTNLRANYSADLQHRLGLDTLAQQQQRFNTILPMLQNAYNASTTGSGTSDITATIPQAPMIDTGPIFGEQGIQNRVNAIRAQTDTGAATEARESAKDLVGRGFGSKSPLIALLGNMARGQGRASATAAEENLRFGAAEANAENLLKQQGLQSENYRAQLAAMTEQQRNKQLQQNALISALASLAG